MGVKERMEDEWRYYHNEYLFKNIRNFTRKLLGKEPLKEKEKKPASVIYDIKKFRLEYMFDNWLEEANLVLSNFIEKNPKKMEGFTFHTYYNTSDDPRGEDVVIRRLENGNFYIEKIDSYSGKVRYLDYCDKEGYVSEKKDIESGLGYDSNSLSKVLLDAERTDMRSYDGHFSNRSRNEYLKEFKKQTGFNLKREVQNKSKGEIKMTKQICLKFLRNGHCGYHGMRINKENEEIGISELLKIIEAKELIECKHSNGHVNHKEPYINSGELNNRSVYEVRTEDFERTLKLIRKYNHKN